MPPIDSALILAGGKGRRMAPFDQARPKCLLPVALEPLVLRACRQLMEQGIGHIVVMADRRFAPMIEGALAEVPEATVVVASGDEGSFGAVHTGQTQFPPGQGYVVWEGDLWVSDAALQRFFEQMREYPTESAWVLVDSLGAERPQHWTVAEMSDSGRVQAIWGHPRTGTWRVSGVYVVAGDAPAQSLGRWGIRGEVGAMPPEQYDWVEVIATWVAGGIPVRALAAQGPVINLDKPWHLWEANRAALHERAARSSETDRQGTSVPASSLLRAKDPNMAPSAILRGPVWMGQRSVIGPGAIIEGPTVIGNDCRIDDYAKVSHAVIGHGSVISHTAEFLGGVLFNQVYLMHNCEVYGILGENVDIGAGTVFGTLRFDDGESAHRVGRHWEVPVEGANAAYLGDFCRTGVNVIVLPGKHIGAYSVVGPGVVVDRDIEPRTQVVLKQQWVTQAWGPERYGW